MSNNDNQYRITIERLNKDSDKSYEDYNEVYQQVLSADESIVAEVVSTVLRFLETQYPIPTLYAPEEESNDV